MLEWWMADWQICPEQRGHQRIFHICYLRTVFHSLHFLLVPIFRFIFLTSCAYYSIRFSLHIYSSCFELNRLAFGTILSSPILKKEMPCIYGFKSAWTSGLSEFQRLVGPCQFLYHWPILWQHEEKVRDSGNTARWGVNLVIILYLL